MLIIFRVSNTGLKLCFPKIRNNYLHLHTYIYQWFYLNLNQNYHLSLLPTQLCSVSATCWCKHPSANPPQNFNFMERGLFRFNFRVRKADQSIHFFYEACNNVNSTAGLCFIITIHDSAGNYLVMFCSGFRGYRSSAGGISTFPILGWASYLNVRKGCHITSSPLSSVVDTVLQSNSTHKPKYITIAILMSRYVVLTPYLGILQILCV